MAEQTWHECIEAARLAPSKHNAQPWWFEVAPDEGVVEIHADGARAMPASDPDGRELVVGCGAALYNLCLAIRCGGHRPLVTPFPGGAPSNVVARVATDGPYRPSDDERALLAAVPRRHSNRNPLDATLLGADVPFVLQRAAQDEGATLHLVTSPGASRAIDDLVTRGDRAAVRDLGVDAELRAWVRPPGVAAPDGIPATAVGRGAAGSYRGRFVQRDFDVHGTVPSGRPAGDAADRPLVAVLWTDRDDAAAWLRAGSALEAVLLALTARGGAASLLNQPLEVPALRAAVRFELGLPGFPQAILRMGVGAPVPPTPRRAVADVLGPMRGGAS